MTEEKSILEKIVEAKQKRLSNQKAELGFEQLQSMVLKAQTAQKIGFKESLLSQSPSIIAEYKRKSPSKGWLCRDYSPQEIALQYQNFGAKALSILTEEDFFAGSSDDLRAVSGELELPVLRKDFIIDPYQIWEAKFIGAKAILLIVSILSDEDLEQFYNLSRKLSMDVLFEVHSFQEVERILPLKPEIIGVNNRNLHDFSVDLRTSLDIIERFGRSIVPLWVSESGIQDRFDIQTLSGAGFQAFLIGESLLTASNRSEYFRNLTKV